MSSIKLFSAMFLFILTSCSAQNEIMQEKNEIPEHLKVWRGLSVLKEDRFVDAPEEDINLAKSYPLYKEKGEWIDDTRLTIITSKTSYKIDEEIRVVHVVESIKSDYELYIMGPKIISGESVNGNLTTPAVSEDIGDPLIPMIYDGATVKCPAVDYNYEVTSYTFGKSGKYVIQWKLGGLTSNKIKIIVKD